MQKGLRGKRVLKVVLWVVGVLLLVVLLLFVVLLINSPGKTAPLLDNAGNPIVGGISERVTLPVNGFDQGMILQGVDETNPVLLFLHGGPGNPEYILAKNYDIGLEEYFTVCWWDQKGSGMSYSSAIDPATMTMESMVADTLAVTDYLRERFGVDQIYLMGHSWGSFLGMHVIDQYPERYAAYIGIGQVVNQLQSEQLSHAAMLEHAREAADTKLENKLLEHNLQTPQDITTSYLMLRSDTLTNMGNGVFHARQSQWNDILKPLLTAREYTLGDKYGYLMGSLDSLSYPINNTQMETDLRQTIPSVQVPVYIFHGEYDLQVSYTLSRQYYEMLDAPEKQFYSFANSAHSPFMEEPEQFMEYILADVLAG